MVQRKGFRSPWWLQRSGHVPQGAWDSPAGTPTAPPGIATPQGFPMLASLLGGWGGFPDPSPLGSPMPPTSLLHSLHSRLPDREHRVCPGCVLPTAR